MLEGSTEVHIPPPAPPTEAPPSEALPQALPQPDATPQVPDLTPEQVVEANATPLPKANTPHATENVPPEVAAKQAQFELLLRGIQKLPGELQQEAFTLMDEAMAPELSEKDTEKKITDFIDKAQSKVDPEGRATLDILKSTLVDPINPTDALGPLNKVLQDANASPEQKAQAHKAMAAMSELMPAIEKAQGLKSAGQEVPEEDKSAVRRGWDRAKRPLRLFGLGVIGLFLVYLFKGFKSGTA